MEGRGRGEWRGHVGASVGHVGLLPLESLEFLVELVTIGIKTILLLFHALSVLALELLDHLRMRLLSIGLVIEVHFLLELKRLLEFLLEFFEVSLGLVTL